MTTELQQTRENPLDRWLQRAAVLDTFAKSDLVKVAESELPWSEIERRSHALASGRRRLRDSVRANQLRFLLDENRVAVVRDALKGPESRRQEFLDAWLRGEQVEWEELEAADLKAAHQVLRWLEPIPDPDRPQVWELEGRLRVLERLEPLQEMVRHFIDRDRQMGRMEKYIEEGGKPLMLHGLGGAGKSALVSNFILRLSECGDTSWIYLDLDDEALNPKEPLTLVEEMVRQLRDQHGESDRVSRVALENLESMRSAQKYSKFADEYTDHSIEHLWQQANEKGPTVIILDTFERAQVLGPEIAQMLIQTIMTYLYDHDRMRLIVSGRVKMDGLASIEVGDLPKSFAINLLRERTENKTPKNAIAKLVDRVGRLPLTLLLTGDVLNQIAESESASLSDLDNLEKHLDAAHIQGFLYTRLLGHLSPGKDYRKIAHATLAVPAFNEELLMNVIVPMADVDPVVAERTFELLRMEVAFVRSIDAGEGWFAHRGD